VRRVRSFEAQGPYEFLVAQSVLNVLAELVVRVKGVGETEICNDDILIAVQQQVLELEISVHNTLPVQIAHAGDELGE
jgi:hypothetical protein